MHAGTLEHLPTGTVQVPQSWELLLPCRRKILLSPPRLFDPGLGEFDARNRGSLTFGLQETDVWRKHEHTRDEVLHTFVITTG